MQVQRGKDGIKEETLNSWDKLIRYLSHIIFSKRKWDICNL